MDWPSFFVNRGKTNEAAQKSSVSAQLPIAQTLLPTASLPLVPNDKSKNSKTPLPQIVYASSSPCIKIIDAAFKAACCSQSIFFSFCILMIMFAFMMWLSATFVPPEVHQEVNQATPSSRRGQDRDRVRFVSSNEVDHF